ncbi:TIGR03936 family radical SAM-associated protein [Actinokineospora globicatena]|uniref:TIGR03936 family radical SAM-associated protein n=1 Tax=Actinokineospora globicatena TaxID=103729 RepID=UPI0020A2A96C|nr:TIGR03936 family radical SAM-associated protein [Actinokineospora globicatena]MCP2305252.1 radical SAM-linked protein [Actinokineospora globicatena]GLW80728.1 radical SAM protein [Actinokineospora globicatena]GLW87555.1 radical SAM protein [Actinokineospora globicatena]
MQKIRLRYAKRGRLRFTSHRDVARAFERALRRAGVPMAYSQGFNPHPKISWIGAAPTGVASEAEYVEVSLVERVDPATLAQVLDTALAPGLDVLEAVEAGPGGFAERMEASDWRIELPGVDPGDLRGAVERLLATEHVEVERLTKDGRRLIDARPAVIRAVVLEGPAETEETPIDDDAPGRVGADMSYPERSCGILRVVVRQTTPAVRPDDVLSALRVVAALEPPVPAKATRLAQGRLDDDGGLSDPLALDRQAGLG